MTAMRRLVSLVAAGVLGLAPLPARPEPVGPKPDAPETAPIPEAEVVRPGAVVHFQYVLRDDKGELLESSWARSPLVVTHGTGQIIPGLERALTGMKVGDVKHVTVPPEDGYGPVDPAAITEVPKSRIPPEALQVGARLVGQTRSRREVPVRVREIKDETVVLDLNHPLAGQTLVFEVTIILVEPPGQ